MGERSKGSVLSKGVTVTYRVRVGRSFSPLGRCVTQCHAGKKKEGEGRDIVTAAVFITKYNARTYEAVKVLKNVKSILRKVLKVHKKKHYTEKVCKRVNWCQREVTRKDKIFSKKTLTFPLVLP